MDGKPRPPWIDEMNVHFAQEADTCASDMDVQEMDILVTRSDMTSDFFYCLTTKRWAVDDADELVALLDRVKAAVDAASSTTRKKNPRKGGA